MPIKPDIEAVDDIYQEGKAGTIAEGIKLAEQSIDSQAAAKKLELLRECSH